MLTFESCDGNVIRVGQNSAENDQIVKLAKQNDLWFHLEGAPSCHVTLACGNSSASSDAIQECLQLLKHYSKSKNVKSAKAIYTIRKNITKKGTNNKSGMVIIVSNKLVTTTDVYTDEPLLERLQATQKSSTTAQPRRKGPMTESKSG